VKKGPNLKPSELPMMLVQGLGGWWGWGWVLGGLLWGGGGGEVGGAAVEPARVLGGARGRGG